MTRRVCNLPAAAVTPSRRTPSQVHPSDDYPELIPAGDTGKTEAWVVLAAGSEARIYAGLKVGTSAGVPRQAIAQGTVADQLASFTPKPGDSVFIQAGTVHSVCRAGRGQLKHAGGSYTFGKGGVLLVPAAVGACSCRLDGAVSLLEVSLPERLMTS